MRASQPVRLVLPAAAAGDATASWRLRLAGPAMVAAAVGRTPSGELTASFSLPLAGRYSITLVQEYASVSPTTRCTRSEARPRIKYKVWSMK